jgi:hypothetical protein
MSSDHPGDAPQATGEESDQITVFENDACRMEFRPGNGRSKDLVIAFTGAQQRLGGIQHGEFAKSITNLNLVRDSLYVSDKNISWYNSFTDNEIKWIDSFYTYENVITIGNSMGGFGAIMFALLIRNATLSISFSPQYSIDSEIVEFEERWADYRAKIEQILYKTCLPDGTNINRGLKHYIFCGEANENDRIHAKLIQEAAANTTTVFVISGCGHEAPQYLKQHGALVPILDGLMTSLHPSEAVEATLRRCGLGYTIWPPK